MYVTVNAPNDVGSQNELMAVVISELRQYQRRNGKGSLGFA